MRRTALIILAIAGGAIALVLIAAAIAVATVDVNTFVAPLQAQVKRATGRDLTLQGPVELKLSLEPKLVASNVAFSNAPWAHGNALLSAKRVEAQVALLPLLKRRFEIVQLTLVEPIIALETDSAGRGNWELGSASTPSTPSSPVAAAAPALGVGTLEIRDGTLTMRDATSAIMRTVEIQSLVLHAQRGGTPIDAKFKGSVDGVPVAVSAELGPLDDLLNHRFPYPVSISGEIAGRNATLATKYAQVNGATQLNEVNATFGNTKVQGSVVIAKTGDRAHYTVDLFSPSLALADLPIAGAAVAAAADKSAAKPAHDAYTIPDAPLPLDTLRKVDADGHVHADVLVLRDGEKVGKLDVTFVLRNGVLDADVAPAQMFGGTIQGHANVSGEGAGAMKLKLEGRDLDLGMVLAATGTHREVRGGMARVSIDVAGHGSSPHQWAASMSGTVLVAVGPAQLPKPKQPADTSVTRVASAVNPFRETDSITDLKCAVLRLPITNGVAHVDQSIAAETNKLAATASGTVDFGHEMIDLSVRPQFREGIAIEIPQVADLVRLRGPFREPQVTIDSTRAAASVARIGAAVLTGGWSVLGETLLAQGNPTSPCAIALGAKASDQRASAPAANAPGNPPSEIGRALGKLFGR